ncbi:MAG TPA: Isoquinoline 1-oxidoreductase subunit [Acidobacteriota bacterium]|nr:Isoquinoline 1-oxidoreductase subunit [Acidobacteriota bacterium]
MKNRLPVVSLLLSAVIVAATLLLLQGAGTEQSESSGKELRAVSAFASIEDESQRSAAIFRETGKVLQHPRCINCHPAGERPLQGDDGRPHMPRVERGLGGTGVAGMRCIGCHASENFDPAGVPGHTPWRLAPASMGWEGKSLSEICQQLKDSERNGGKSLKEVVEHMAEDGLVGWAWHPGQGRTPPPGSQERLGELFQAWADSGAVCP